MNIKSLVKRSIKVVARLPLLRRIVIALYERNAASSEWHRIHPYDAAHGVRTSGELPGFLLNPGATAYAAAQPSIIRTALAAIPDPEKCEFFDLGCGKGRPLFIATEFSFPVITGIEFSPTLARTARRNTAAFASQHADRTPISIICGDALSHSWPLGAMVIFLYNPFGESQISTLLAGLEARSLTNHQDLYVVYYNPTWGALFDASDVLERRYAAQIPYDASELGFGPDLSDGIVIWQNRGNLHSKPNCNPEASIDVISAGRRAEVVMA